MTLPPSDFRHAAVAATAASGRDAFAGGGPSACIPTGRGAGFRLMSVALYGCLAVAAPAVLAFFAAPGFVAQLGGPGPYGAALLFLCFGPPLLVRVWIAWELGPRKRPPAALRSPNKPQRLFVSSERRFAQPWRSASDLGWLHADPDAGTAVLEGLVCRYVFHRGDVRSLREVSACGILGVEVECDVAGETLVLVFSQPDSVSGVALRMIGMAGHTRWVELLRDTLR